MGDTTPLWAIFITGLICCAGCFIHTVRAMHRESIERKEHNK